MALVASWRAWATSENSFDVYQAISCALIFWCPRSVGSLQLEILSPSVDPRLYNLLPEWPELGSRLLLPGVVHHSCLVKKPRPLLDVLCIY